MNFRGFSYLSDGVVLIVWCTIGPMPLDVGLSMLATDPCCFDSKGESDFVFSCITCSKLVRKAGKEMLRIEGV